MTKKIAKTCTNLIAIALGVLVGLVFFADLLPLNQASGLKTFSDYLVFGSDVFFSLVACGLGAIFTKFVLWDCVIQPVMSYALKQKGAGGKDNS